LRLTLTVSHWTDNAYAYPADAQNGFERLYIPKGPSGRWPQLCGFKAVLGGFEVVLISDPLMGSKGDVLLTLHALLHMRPREG
jgi:hypothetical protein